MSKAASAQGILELQRAVLASALGTEAATKHDVKPALYSVAATNNIAGMVLVVLNVQVSDTTGDATCTAVGNQKTVTNFLSIFRNHVLFLQTENKK